MDSDYFKKRFRSSLILAVIFCLTALYELFITKSFSSTFLIVVLIGMPLRVLIDYHTYKVGTTDTIVYKYGTWLIYGLIAVLIVCFIVNF